VKGCGVARWLASCRHKHRPSAPLRSSNSKLTQHNPPPTTKTTHPSQYHPQRPSRNDNPSAARAAESERDDRFVYDPLASVLAGRRALSRYKLRPHNVLLIPRTAPIAPAAPAGWSQRNAAAAAATAAAAAADDATSEAGAGARATSSTLTAFTPPARPVPRLVMRTRFFDDAVLAATWGSGMPAPDALGPTAATVDALADAGHGPCRQVVMLGAGASCVARAGFRGVVGRGQVLGCGLGDRGRAVSVQSVECTGQSALDT